MHIRQATSDDVSAVKALLDGNKDMFGFIPRPAVQSSIDNGEVLVVQRGSTIDGFCRYHKRRDGQTTIYELFVSQDCRHSGIARAVIERLKPPILAKCPVDLPGNGFYKATGFELKETVRGKKRPLNLWIKR